MYFDKPINLYKPDYVIKLKDLNYPSDIYGICKKHHISYFGYGFRYVKNSYNTLQLKFGHSAPDADVRPSPMGERLVRQASWLPGWPAMVHSSHGFELWHGCTNLIKQNKMPSNVDYTDFEIAIWSGSIRKNITGHPMTEKDTAEFIESMLCALYSERHGKLPPLNIADPTRNKLYKSIVKTNFLDLFTVE
jgi:hypothetical protein